jgi:ankyrin repeat protein
MKAGAYIDDRDIHDCTPLMYAAEFNENPDVVTALLEAGAKLNDRDELDMTPLMYAAWFNENPDVTTALVKAGAKIDDYDGLGMTPLMLAAEFNKNSNVIVALLKAGADVNEHDDLDMTPLIYAAEHNENPEVISALLQAGANANFKSYNGMTALDYAEKNPKLKGTLAYDELKNATLNSNNVSDTTSILNPEYWIQAGCFGDKSTADKLCNEFISRGMNATITKREVAIGSHDYYVVNVGPYASSDEAKKYLPEIKAVRGASQDSFVTTHW